MAPSGPPAKAASKAAAPAKEDKKKKKEKKEKIVEEEEKPKMQAPDEEKYKEKVDKINAEIEKLQGKLKALSAEIGERSVGKEGFFEKKAALREELNKHTAIIDALVAEKDGVFKQIGENKEEGKKQRAELNKMKKSMEYTSEEQIADRIRAIDAKMAHSSLTLKEEKELLKEISELKRNRPKLAQVAQLESKVGSFDVAAPLKERTADLKERLNAARDAKKVVSEQYKALMEERDAAQGNLPELFKERESLNEKIREKIAARNEARDEYRQEERLYKAYLQELRNARWERQRAEREARDLEYAKEKRIRDAEKLEEQPHIAETTLIEQSLLFCKSLLPKEEESKVVDKKEITHNVKDGEIVLAKKGEEEEYYFAPTKKAKASKAKGKKESKAIKHNAETFRLFSQLKLDAPVTTDDIPALVEKLEEQKKMYEEKIAVWREKREEMKAKILAGESLEEEDAKAEEAE